MRIKRLFAAALVAALALPAVMMLAGCEHYVASREIHGTWVGHGGIMIEFVPGRFTRTLPGEVQTGTFTTETQGGRSFVTLHRQGLTPETLEYSLDFPRLVLGGTTFFHDSPRLPPDMEGVWDGFPALLNTTRGWSWAMHFGEARPQRGDPWRFEGSYRQSFVRGVYSFSSRGVPGSGTFTTRITHVTGSEMYARIVYRMDMHLMRYFDLEALHRPPHISYYDWLFSLEDARGFFHDAMARAGNSLGAQQGIRAALNAFLPPSLGQDSTWAFTLEEGVDIYDFAGRPVTHNGTLLTIESPDGLILTFYRMTNGQSASVPFGYPTLHNGLFVGEEDEDDEWWRDEIEEQPTPEVDDEHAN